MPSVVRHCEVGSGLVRVLASMWSATAGTGLTAATAWVAVTEPAAPGAICAAAAAEDCARAMSSAAAPASITGIDLRFRVCRKSNSFGRASSGHPGLRRPKCMAR